VRQGRDRMLRSRMVHWGLLTLPLVFLALFYFYPLARIITLSLLPEGGWRPEQLQRLLAGQVFGRIIWFTVWQAALSTLLTLAAALPGVYLFARFRFPGRQLLLALSTVPFVLPTVVTAAAFRALLGDHGLVNSWLVGLFDLAAPPIRLERTVAFFLLAHVFYNYALVLRIVSGYWSGLDQRLSAAARMLGASPWQVFRRITLPLLTPAIGSAALLVFIFCFTSFGVVLILGGPGYATLEVEIYRQTVQLFNLPMAAALSLIQIGINFLLMLLYNRMERKHQASFTVESPSGETVRAAGIGTKLLVGLNAAFMTVLLVAPLLALVVRSLIGENGFTLAYYRDIFISQGSSVYFVEPLAAVFNSIGFGLATMTLAVLLGLLAATFIASGSGREKLVWDALIMLPLATSAVTLGFGFIVALNRPPLNLRDSLALVPIAHSLVAFPFVIRCILPSIRRIPVSLREAAALLGASPLAVWRHVDLPLTARAILVGAVFAFSISMGEFGASAFVTRPHTSTMPVAIFRYLGQPGEMNYGRAMAMSTLLMLVTCSGFWLLGKIDHLRRAPER